MSFFRVPDPGFVLSDGVMISRVLPILDLTHGDVSSDIHQIVRSEFESEIVGLPCRSVPLCSCDGHEKS